MAKKEQLQRPRGTSDIVPDQWPVWNRFADVVQRVTDCYNFGRIETPVIEHTELFERGVGEDTDIVQKEMYSFKTAGGTRLTMRPEGTAPVVRAYIENGMKVMPQPVKLWYYGPMFRHERPQAGRYREFHQFGGEIIGDDDPVLDAEIIQMTVAILQELEMRNLLVLVNSVGCSSCRSSYLKELKDTVGGSKKSLCKECRARVDTNPMRVLDCKEEKCQQVAARAPMLIDHLCEECHEAFTNVLEYLDALEIPYHLNPRLVRGLDYYTKTVFEVVVQDDGDTQDDADASGDDVSEDDSEEQESEETSEDAEVPTDQEMSEEGARIALAGGGRYDGLVEELGGGDTPAVGVSIGVERVFLEMERQGVLPDPPLPPRVFLAQLGEDARKRSLVLLEELRGKDITPAYAFSKGSMKSQLKIADKIGADAALIIGRKEAMADEIILRDMENGTQETIAMSRVITELRKILRRKPRALKMREAGIMGGSDDDEEDEENEE